MAASVNNKCWIIFHFQLSTFTYLFYQFAAQHFATDKYCHFTLIYKSLKLWVVGSNPAGITQMKKVIRFEANDFFSLILSGLTS